MVNETIEVNVKINGKPTHVRVPSTFRLLDMLRETLLLTGTKEGCGAGDCGTCTVILNGKPVNSCLTLAAQADQGEVLTIEGMSEEHLHPIQQALIDEGGVQCGFCTPGVIMTAFALLKVNPHPSEVEIREALAGNLCRCTGYSKIISAIQKVSQ